jgi:hypothetical protein
VLDPARPHRGDLPRLHGACHARKHSFHLRVQVLVMPGQDPPCALNAAPAHVGAALCHPVDAQGRQPVRANRLNRSRPASGVLFMTLEDEAGFANLVVWEKVFRQYRTPILTNWLPGVTGKLQVDMATSPLHGVTPMPGLSGNLRPPSFWRWGSPARLFLATVWKQETLTCPHPSLAGIESELAERVFSQILSLGEYGFPEGRHGKP